MNDLTLTVSEFDALSSGTELFLELFFTGLIRLLWKDKKNIKRRRKY
jgi:hypothetical protein